MTAATSRLERWDLDGYLVAAGLLADLVPELDVQTQLLAARTDLISDRNIRCRWADHVDTKECRFDCFDPVTDLSEPIARAAHDPRLLALLAELYGEPAYLFKDKLIYKPDGAPGYELHQDYIAWDEFPKSFVTAIVAIDASDERSGGTEFFGGEHSRGLLSPPDGQFHRLQVDALSPGVRGTVPTLNPGDVVLFSGYLPHRSAPNRSGRPRRLLYFSYNAASDGGDARKAHYRQFHAWLGERYADDGKLDTYFR